MRVTLDTEVDMAYIRLVDHAEPGAAVRQTVAGSEADSTVVLDYDRDGRLIGLEVFSASRQLPPNLLDTAVRHS